MSAIQPFIDAIDAAHSSDDLLDAVEALAEQRSPEAIPKLIETLGYNNPGAAVAAVDGLIQIGNPAVAPLLELLDNYNYGARAWAIRALAGIGNPSGLNVLLTATSSDFALSVRRAAAHGLGTIQWHILPETQRHDGQQQCVEVLLNALHDPEWVVRYAAVAGLQSLMLTLCEEQPTLIPNILETCDRHLQTEETPAVQARLRLSQQRIQTHLTNT